MLYTDVVICAAALIIAIWFRPWQMLRAAPLQNSWLTCLLVLPWMWGAQRLLPPGLALQLSGASLLVLMFGWPLAIITILLIAAIGGWLANAPLHQMLMLATWNGVVPATLALGIGLTIRRLLPKHLFIYILGRGFIATGLAMSVAGCLSVLLHPQRPDTELSLVMLAHILMASGEAFATGMLTAIFVAFKPEWMVTWSDRRYLSN